MIINIIIKMRDDMKKDNPIDVFISKRSYEFNLWLTKHKCIDSPSARARFCEQHSQFNTFVAYLR